MKILLGEDKSAMKQDDRDMLMVLGVMGAMILAGGVGMAIVVAHNNPGFGEAAVGFASGAFLTAAGIFVALTRD